MGISRCCHRHATLPGTAALDPVPRRRSTLSTHVVPGSSGLRFAVSSCIFHGMKNKHCISKLLYSVAAVSYPRFDLTGVPKPRAKMVVCETTGQLNIRCVESALWGCWVPQFASPDHCADCGDAVLNFLKSEYF